MTVGDIVNTINLKVLAASKGLDIPVAGGYSSDLLSNVMGFAGQGSIWITMQGHQNIVAVASLAGLAAIIVAGGAEPEKEAVQKAEAEGVILLASELSCFELAGQLYQMGIKGN